MSGSRIALGLALVLASFAGCVTPSDGATAATLSASLPSDWYHAALAHDEGHNHSALAEHLGASTPNFRLLGHEPLLTKAYEGKPASGYGCGDIATTPEGGRRISLVSGFMDDVVFMLVDVTDPARPIQLGEFYSVGMKSWDSAMTPDGKWALIAFTGQPRVPGGALPGLSFRTLCSHGAFSIPVDDATSVIVPGTDTAITNGLVLVDISDPTAPKYADWEPTPGRNMHSVSSAEIDGETWIMASVLGGASVPGAPGAVPRFPLQHQLSYVAFDQIQDTPLGPKLVRVSTFQLPVTIPTEGSPVVPLRNGHVDAHMQRHPGDDKVYVYMANWEGGVITIDFSDPRVPKPAGQWMPPHDAMPKVEGDGPCYLSAIHGVLPAPEMWDGKHYYFAGQECPTKVDEKRPGGSIFIVDNTDPAQPTLVGSWHPPEETGVWTAVYQASPHYVALHNRTLFVTMYHAGLWAVDLSDPATFAAPPAIGVYLPDIAPPVPLDVERPSPSDEQVDVFPDGTIVLIEQASGVYVLDFDASDPAPPAKPYAYDEQA